MFAKKVNEGKSLQRRLDRPCTMERHERKAEQKMANNKCLPEIERKSEGLFRVLPELSLKPLHYES